MTKKDVLELKRRLKKNECTFTKLCGCYVNGEKNILLKLDQTFLNLKEDEFYKYLEIAKKTLSGTVGNNLLELDFPLEEEKAGGKQQFLLGLKESRLKNEGLLDSFYQLVIDNYDYAGNYLILIFHDAYDVMSKTSDNIKLDESEEVYEYLLCAVCPVTLTKPGLGYIEDENRIGPRFRDWVVNPPDTGFVFPAFSERSTDIHSILYYTKDAKEPHKEFMEYVLGCPPIQTATEQKNTFQTIINNAIHDEEKSNKIFMEIQESLNQMVDDHAVFNDSKQEPLLLTTDSIQEIIGSCDLPEEITKKIENSFAEQFRDTPPIVEHLIDSKLLAENARQKKEQELEEKIQLLQVKLEEVIYSNTDTNTSSINSSDSNDSDSTGTLSRDTLSIDTLSHDTLSDANSITADSDVTDTSQDDNLIHSAIQEDNLSSNDLESNDANHSDIESSASANKNFDVILRVKPQKMQQITSQIIDGKKCIVIPMDENELADVEVV